MGFVEQSSSRSPRTFLGAFGRPPPFPVSSLSIADLWIAATPREYRHTPGKDDCVSEDIESARGMKTPCARRIHHEVKI